MNPGKKSMRLRTLLSVHSILLFLFGLGFLVAPEMMLSFYGTSTNSTGLLTARVFGIGSIQLSVLMWSSYKCGETRILSILVPLQFLGNSLSFLLALQAQLSGIFNVLGWTNTSLYLLFALGYGYFLLLSIRSRDDSR